MKKTLYEQYDNSVLYYNIEQQEPHLYMLLY